MPTWLLIVVVVLGVLIVGGMLARARQFARNRHTFDAALAKVDRDLAAAAAQDKGWDRAHLEAVARRAAAEQLGSDPDELVLVEVLDRPGTEADEAVFRVASGGRRERLVLGRDGGEWVPAQR